ncbi:1464_t:CDS:2 [Diversispora eburnea]|uniref:1464_t:CDS:1 n=1 Tax=Diversispora eburnea TaxID=1213867 RepID=A0A9N9CCC5_9GLOM|nr:1464_t:CDS:2 [Diversispora eburnea]
MFSQYGKHLASAQRRYLVSENSVKAIGKLRDIKEYVPAATLIVSIIGLTGGSVFAMNHLVKETIDSAISSAIGPLEKKLDQVDHKVDKLESQMSYVLSQMSYVFGYLQIPMKEEPKKE